MIKEVSKCDKLFETGFVLEIIRVSNYLKSMKEAIGKRIEECMAKEIRENYPPFKDPFFSGVIEPLQKGEYYDIFRNESIEEFAEKKLLREGKRRRSGAWRKECLRILSNFEIISE
jgi:hypothetical protein